MARKNETLIPALLVCGALAATGVFHTWQRVEGIHLGYRLGEVTSEHRNLMRQNEHLRLEVATLKAPARIERLAREEFGMEPPRPSQVIVVRSSPAGAPTRTSSDGAGSTELAKRDASASPDALVARVPVREEPRG